MNNRLTAEEIFHVAREKLEPAERAGYLEGACGHDVSLRAKVDALLRADAEAGEFLRTVAGAPPSSPATLTDALRVQASDMIGRYKLLQQIGEGGFGVVFMAAQEVPVRRRVAIKIIKVGMDTKQVIARFEAERQALAIMDHPNIARVLDAGATETGRPFFVMELVKGDPIVEYCDKNNLSIADRLELFAQVCNAVQHAHTKGIIHRDLKPSNILVSTQDGRPHTKVIDFGIAKATASKLTEKTLFTEHRALIGTPEYMSPEQAEGSMDIDTRTDVYSLGVLLYELLTGTTPFTSGELRSAAYAEIQRIIREVDPPKPSTRLSANTDTLASIAAKRHTEPKRLGIIIRGDLDWIVMKALEKDRQRRYETANGLAMDIWRYLSGEAVLAAPPSAGYKVRKFIKRNKAGVTAATLVAAMLVLGVAGTTWGMLWALDERDRADQEATNATFAAQAEHDARLEAQEASKAARAAEADATQRAEGERLAKEQAQHRMSQLEKGNEILGSIFASLDPKAIAMAEQPLQAMLVSNLVRAAEQLESEAIGDPLTVARMQMTLARSLVGLGAAERAIPLLLDARNTLQTHLDPDDPEMLLCMNDLTMAYWDNGDLDLALPLAVETLDRRTATLGPDHADTLVSMNALASVYTYLRQFDKSIPLFQELLDRQETMLGRNHPEALVPLGNLGINYRDAGRFDEAMPLLEEVLTRLKAAAGPGHPHTLIAMTNLGQAYQHAGRFDLALPLFEETIERANATLGPDHPHTRKTVASLANAYWMAGQFDKSIPLYEAHLKRLESRLGQDHPETLEAAANLGANYLARGRRDHAMTLLEATIERARAVLGPEHPTTLLCLGNLSATYMETGDFDRALPLLEESLAVTKATLGSEHPNTLQMMNNLGVAYWQSAQLDKSIPLFETTLALCESKLGPTLPLALQVAANLAVNYRDAGRPAEATPLLEESLRRREAMFGRQHPDTLAIIADLGMNYRDTGRLAEAIPLLEEAHRAVKSNPGLEWVTLELFAAYVRERPAESIKHWAALIPTLQADFGDDHIFTILAMNNLGYALARSGRYVEAEAMLTDTIEREVRTLGEEHMLLLQTRTNLGESYHLQGKNAQAEELLRKCLAEREKVEPNSFRLASTQSMLGRVLAQKKEYAEAEALLLAGHKGLAGNASTTPDWGKYYLPDTLEWLTQLYGDWGKSVEAAKWQIQLEAAQAEQAAAAEADGPNR